MQKNEQKKRKEKKKTFSSMTMADRFRLLNRIEELSWDMGRREKTRREELYDR